MLVSSTGFLVNMACLFMNLCYPFTKDPSNYIKHFKNIDTWYFTQRFVFKNLESLGSIPEEEAKEPMIENFSFVNECFSLGLAFTSIVYGSNSMIHDLRKEYEGVLKWAQKF